MPGALLLGIDRSEIRQEAAERALRRQKSRGGRVSAA